MACHNLLDSRTEETLLYSIHLGQFLLLPSPFTVMLMDSYESMHRQWVTFQKKNPKLREPKSFAMGVKICLPFVPGLPWCGSAVKNLPASAQDVCSIPGSKRYLGEGNSNPFQYSCLGNPKDYSLVGYSPWGCRVRQDLAAELTPFVPWRDPIFIFQGYLLTNSLENWKQSN